MKRSRHVQRGVLSLETFRIPRSDPRRNFDVLDRPHLFSSQACWYHRHTKSKPVFFYGERRWHFFGPSTVSSISELAHSVMLHVDIQGIPIYMINLTNPFDSPNGFAMFNTQYILDVQIDTCGINFYMWNWKCITFCVGYWKKNMRYWREQWAYNRAVYHK